MDRHQRRRQPLVDVIADTELGHMLAITLEAVTQRGREELHTSRKVSEHRSTAHRCRLRDIVDPRVETTNRNHMPGSAENPMPSNVTLLVRKARRTFSHHAHHASVARSSG